MPSAPVSQPNACRQTMSGLIVRDCLVELPRVIPVADFAIGSSERRVPLNVYGANSVSIECVRDANLIENRPEFARFVAAHRDVSEKTESEAVHYVWAHGRGILHHRERRLVLIQKAAQREQSRLCRWRVLAEQLTEHLRAGVQRYV